MKKYIKQDDLTNEEVFGNILGAILLGIPILFYPKWLTAIWFIFLIGTSFMRNDRFKEEDAYNTSYTK